MCITSNANALRDEHAEHEKGRNADACYTEMLRASESNIVEREAEKRGLLKMCAYTFSENHGSGCFTVANLKKKNCFCATDKMRPRHGIYTGADVHANGV